MQFQVFYGEDLYMDDEIPFYSSMDEVKEKDKDWERKLWRTCQLVEIKDKNDKSDKEDDYHVDMKRGVFLLAWSGSPPSYKLTNEKIVHVPKYPLRTFMNEKRDYTKYDIYTV